MTQQSMENAGLEVAQPAQVQQQMGLVDPAGIGIDEQTDPALDKMATDFVSQIMAYNPQDASQLDARNSTIAALERMGSRAQSEAAHRSAMLREPIRKLAARGEDGGPVAQSLVDLKMTVEELDPGKFDFEAGWFTRTLGRLPGVGTPLKRYFTRFESSQTVMDAIMRALLEGKSTLTRDNTTLGQDQKVMRELTLRLQKTIQLGMLIDQKLSYALERELAGDDPRAAFIQEELLFPLRQRIQDLQQQLAVNQQGVLAIELIIRNNKELIKGVDRAVKVTVNALNVAVTVALALANQKIVLDKIEAVNVVTNRLIAQTAATLRSQAASVQQQASQASLDIDTLKKAFQDIHATMEEIAVFRTKALPSMADNILQMDQLTRETEAAIQKLEKGTEAAPSISLEVESL
jgi:uncharacterized protein YaaN involved in tellurite resistance